jgi:hypothetical protein
MFSFLNLLILALTVLSPVILASSDNAKVNCDVEPSALDKLEEKSYSVSCQSTISTQNLNITCCSVSLFNSTPFDTSKSCENVKYSTCECEKLLAIPNDSFKINGKYNPMIKDKCGFSLSYLGSKGK